MIEDGRTAAVDGGEGGAMDILNREDMAELAAGRPGPCVSIYLPTHRILTQTAEDQLRLKNLLTEARNRLGELGLRHSEVATLLAPGSELLDHPNFWRFQQDGLALFLAAGLARFYRLPMAFPELCVVADAFHLKPMLPAMSFDQHFYVLALSKNGIRLLAGDRYGISPVELDNVPKNLADALFYDEPERHLQFHQSAFAGRGRTAAIFHGHGGGKDTARVDLLEYFRQIDAGLHEAIGADRAPLVLAGVDYQVAAYREITSHPVVAAETIKGSPDALRDHDLHERAWSIVAPLFEGESTRAAELVAERAGTGGASTDLVEVVRAAHAGRVASLFVSGEAARWGSFDPVTLDVTVHDDRATGDEDLLDVAAVGTWTTGGAVYVVAPAAVPLGGDLAAVFRY
jgi:hypothetical protein